MPHLGNNNSSTARTSGGSNQRMGQLVFHWSFSHEVDLPGGAAVAPSYGSTRGRSHTVELGTLLDKALAFSG